MIEQWTLDRAAQECGFEDWEDDALWGVLPLVTMLQIWSLYSEA